MNHIRWIAWGVIEIDNKDRFDRMQRRNYLAKMRAEAKEIGVSFEPGGSRLKPWYRVALPIDAKGQQRVKAVGGDNSCKKACMWLLEQLGEANVGGADGGVRSAGAEAEGDPA